MARGGARPGAGAKPKFSSPEDMQAKIQHYFDSITITEPVYDYVVTGKDKKGKNVMEKVPKLNNAGEQIYKTSYIETPGIIAMCRHIGTQRETLNQYKRKEGFKEVIESAKERIEQYLEEQLYRNTQVTGIIFNLKNNFGWKDQQHLEHTGANGGPIVVKLPDELE